MDTLANGTNSLYAPPQRSCRSDTAFRISRTLAHGSRAGFEKFLLSGKSPGVETCAAGSQQKKHNDGQRQTRDETLGNTASGGLGSGVLTKAASQLAETHRDKLRRELELFDADASYRLQCTLRHGTRRAFELHLVDQFLAADESALAEPPRADLGELSSGAEPELEPTRTISHGDDPSFGDSPHAAQTLSLDPTPHPRKCPRLLTPAQLLSWTSPAPAPPVPAPPADDGRLAPSVAALMHHHATTTSLPEHGSVDGPEGGYYYPAADDTGVGADKETRRTSTIAPSVQQLFMVHDGTHTAANDIGVGADKETCGTSTIAPAVRQLFMVHDDTHTSVGGMGVGTEKESSGTSSIAPAVQQLFMVHDDTQTAVDGMSVGAEKETSGTSAIAPAVQQLFMVNG